MRIAVHETGSTPANWLGELYQYANRLAHVHFVRSVADLPAWLVNLCFTGDPRSPTSAGEWRKDCEVVKDQLGLPPVVRSLVVDVLLPPEHGASTHLDRSSRTVNSRIANAVLRRARSARLPRRR
jgi:hypothetical protein